MSKCYLLGEDNITESKSWEVIEQGRKVPKQRE